MYNSYFNSLNTQIRVIFAVMMREIHTIYGKNRLGYLWSIIHFSSFVITIWILRTLIHFKSPHGMTVLSFLVSGYIIFFSFSDGIIKCMKAIESNRALLTFPQVTPIDIMIARCVIEYTSNLVSAVIILAIAYIFGHEFYIRNLGGVLFVLFISFIFTLGFGMICSALNSFFNFIERILPIILRILLFSSGVIFSVDGFSCIIGEWFFWNPILQLIELLRSYISLGYNSRFVSIVYLLIVALYSITIGLILEKFTRKRLMS